MDRKKVRREGKCCDAFRAWCKSEKGRDYIQQLINVMGYESAWIVDQMREAYLWEADPDQPDRWKFSTFFRNWCRNAKKFQIDAERQAKLMSAEQEQQYYEAKRDGKRTAKPRRINEI